MTTSYKIPKNDEPDFVPPKDATATLHSMLARPNLASFEFISMQYDHEVQGGSVVKPLQGRGRVNGDTTITRPVLNSKKGVVISQALNPSYSDINTYEMAMAAVDTSVRNAVSAGAKLEQLALLDNFCWCSSNEPERLGQLKEAVRGCHDAAIQYGTPFISGKDSMFNDFKGFDESGNPVKISVPPTLLISSIGVMEDSTKAVTLDAKMHGDIVYLLGATHDELGGSEYFAMVGEQTRGKRFVGNAVPRANPEINRVTYQRLSQAIDKGLVASAQSVHRGGLATALAKTSMGGKLGMDIDLRQVPTYATRDDFTLYSESQGRIVVTVNPAIAEDFEKVMGNTFVSRIGTVRENDSFVIRGKRGNTIVETTVSDMLDSYKSTFKNY